MLKELVLSETYKKTLNIISDTNSSGHYVCLVEIKSEGKFDGLVTITKTTSRFRAELMSCLDVFEKLPGNDPVTIYSSINLMKGVVTSHKKKMNRDLLVILKKICRQRTIEFVWLEANYDGFFENNDDPELQKVINQLGESVAQYEERDNSRTDN